MAEDPDGDSRGTGIPHHHFTPRLLERKTISQCVNKALFIDLVERLY